MTDHDRAKRWYRVACAMADVKANARSARPWLAKVAGYNPRTSHRWGEDDWPGPARVILDAMAQVHPMQWPGNWRV